MGVYAYIYTRSPRGSLSDSAPKGIQLGLTRHNGYRESDAHHGGGSMYVTVPTTHEIADKLFFSG